MQIYHVTKLPNLRVTRCFCEIFEQADFKKKSREGHTLYKVDKCLRRQFTS